MEMPFDILNTRLGKIRDNGDIDFDNTAAAADIDTELQDKFLFFPFEELEAVEIEDNRDVLYVGDESNHIGWAKAKDPAELMDLAQNALALWWRLKKDNEAAEKHAAVLARRPEPGVYQAKAADYFTVVVTNDRRVLVQQSLGGLRDSTDIWDGMTTEGATMYWTLQRINLTDGTVAK